MIKQQKEDLLVKGTDLMQRWCAANKVVAPVVRAYREGQPQFNVCAYYRDSTIHIWVHACAAIGSTVRAWSYPGYSVDRTPYGVIAHELAHHVDDAEGSAGGTYGRLWMKETQEKPISGYAPNPNEWFAEMFRLFVTNPNLLLNLRPYTYNRMIMTWPHVVEHRPWLEVLEGAERQIAVVKKRLPICHDRSAKRLLDDAREFIRS